MVSCLFEYQLIAPLPAKKTCPEVDFQVSVSFP